MLLKAPFITVIAVPRVLVSALAARGAALASLGCARETQPRAPPGRGLRTTPSSSPLLSRQPAAEPGTDFF